MSTDSEPGPQPPVMSALAPNRRPSLEGIYRDHLGDVLFWLRRAGVAERDLEDVAHKVFLEVHGALPSYDPSRPLKPWLKSISVRTGWHHRGLAHHAHETLVDDFAHPDEAPTSEERLGAEQRAQAVREVLASMDEVLVMYELDGLAMDEIAEQLQIPVNTLYSRRRRALAQFRAAWKRRHGEGAMGAAVPITLGQAAIAGGSSEGGESVPASVRDRLWRRLGEDLHVPSPPPSAGPLLAGKAALPAAQAAALSAPKLAVAALLFALGTGTGALLHGRLGASPAEGAHIAAAPTLTMSTPGHDRTPDAPRVAPPPVDAPDEGPQAPRVAPSVGIAVTPPPGAGAGEMALGRASAHPPAAAPSSPPAAAASPGAPPSAAASAGVDAAAAALAREQQLIKAAKSAQLRGDTAGAIDALRQHQREFPRGIYAQEREGMLAGLLATPEVKP